MTCIKRKKINGNQNTKKKKLYYNFFQKRKKKGIKLTYVKDMSVWEGL